MILERLVFPLVRCARWLLGLSLSVALALSATAATLVVGPGGQPESLADALARAEDGDLIQVLPGEYKLANLIITKKRLTIRGESVRPIFVGDGKLGDGGAILVIRDGHIRLENIEFRGARGAGSNAAGVLLEQGKLEVVRCAFFDNEHGLVTGNADQTELDIESSVFARAPRIVGGLNHLLHVGRIARLTVQGSRFHTGFEGHLIKSSARQSIIRYNMIRDGSEGQASYEIDLPSGGDVMLLGNVISQSPRSQNPVLVSYGAEGKVWERNALVLAHNTLISEGWRPAWFLRVHRDRVPGMEETLLVNNLVVGNGFFWLGAAGEFRGNWPATLGMLADAATLAFELPPDSIWRNRGNDPRQMRGRNLMPLAEFEWPAGQREIGKDRSSWSPGAYQR